MIAMLLAAKMRDDPESLISDRRQTDCRGSHLPAHVEYFHGISLGDGTFLGSMASANGFWADLAGLARKGPANRPKLWGY